MGSSSGHEFLYFFKESIDNLCGIMVIMVYIIAVNNVLYDCSLDFPLWEGS